MKRYWLDFFLGAATFWILLGVSSIQGCHRTTLSPDGVYQGNKFWFEADRSLIESKKSLGEFVDWTRVNYVWLHTHGRDDVISAADSVRTNSPMWFSNAWNVRATYTNALYSGSSIATIAGFSNSFASIVSTIQTIRKQNLALTNVITNSIPTHE